MVDPDEKLETGRLLEVHFSSIILFNDLLSWEGWGRFLLTHVVVYNVKSTICYTFIDGVHLPGD